MRELLRAVVPTKLKYRLFAAFVLLILLPFGVLNLYNYQRIEALVQKKLSEQSGDQLKNMDQMLQDQMSIAFKTLIFLEQDSAVKRILQEPGEGSVLSNKEAMEEKFKSLNNSFFLYNPWVYYALLDFHGHVYTSYQPKRALDYDDFRSNPWFMDTEKEGLNYRWVPNEANYVHRDLSTSPYLLSLYAVLRDGNNKPYGMARVSIDYALWFQSALKNSDTSQDYFMITADGETAAKSVKDAELSADVLSRIADKPENGYFIDESSDTLINYSYMDSLDWYMINRIPLNVLFNEISVLKKQYFITFFALTVAFIGMSLLIVHTFIRPLTLLQRKMRDAVRNDFKLKLPESKFTGEVLDLTRTFNGMLGDMDRMIVRLKEEERQRDAVHFQMLLAQMNPHFLLNTLNTMKWIALRNGQEEISDMCVSLGKLLESSLNSAVDLIYVKDEMELIGAFVYIQQVRNNYRFDVQYDYDERLNYALIPKLGLQPLVENAIQHGIGGMAEGGRIVIRIYQPEDVQNLLVIEVEDNGVGYGNAPDNNRHPKRPGIGLANIRERLRLLFKDTGKVEIISLQPGTMVRLTLPFLLSTPYDSMNREPRR